MKSMKRIGLSLLVIVLLFTAFVPVSFADELDVQFIINGEPYVTPKGEPEPYINKDKRTMVPLRFFAEALEIPEDQITWDTKYKIATLKKWSWKVDVKVGDEFLRFMHKEPIIMDTVAEIKDGRIFIPARYVAESLMAKIEYDNEAKTVSLTSHDPDAILDPKHQDVYDEVEKYGTNMRSALGLTPIDLPIELNLGSGVKSTIEQILVVDMEDDNAPYREWFPEVRVANPERGSYTADKDYVIAFKFVIENPGSNSNGTWILEQKVSGNNGMKYYRSVISKGDAGNRTHIAGVNTFRLHSAGIYEGWYLMTISKDDFQVEDHRNNMAVRNLINQEWTLLIESSKN